ncbi:DeoR/GlpR family DNA-binding transcription regulator [Dactylosporangium cerinum]|uniref:DeoR/GlpR family DNA-binding transcription regulator n=1 Tax=Dactylosporangium cerinum TaxID=1434730 RepID=A0ABV9W8Y9_9ACTN
MLASARQVAILEIVDRDGGAQLRQLADLFGVSPGTIRRDLTMLDASGLVARVHGGAVRRPGTARSRKPLRSAVLVRQTARAAIAADAARVVAPGTVVALPAGPISELLAEHLTTVPELTVVTYSLPVAQVFRAHQRDDQTLILTGGVFTGTQGLTGPLAAGTMHSLRIDTGFVEFDGIAPNGRPANVDAGTAELNRAVLAAAARVVCYTDHTAWHRLAAHEVITGASGVLLLVDAHLRQEARGDLASAGIRAVVARGPAPPRP